ncbi:MAG: molybdopterin molybdotransferase MoeA, partial [Miltoncostaeaceae bacterium]
MASCGPHSANGDRPATFEEALSLARGWAVEPPSERVPVARCAGRTLARDVTVAREHPAVDSSAMDGFACRSDDLPGRLRVVGESRAGEPYRGTLSPGQATAISTGAALPAGADTVLRVEDVEVAGKTVAAPARPHGRDVRRAGEALRAGAPLLPAGARIRPQAIVALITAGYATVCCRRRPRVAILTSGDELVRPGHEVGPHQLPDGNGPGIAAQAMAAGAQVVGWEHVGDDRAETERRIERALTPPEDHAPDVLLTVGGVSVGRHDHMRAALAAVGVVPLVDRVAVRPGHPVWLGHRGGQRILALPG